MSPQPVQPGDICVRCNQTLAAHYIVEAFRYPNPRNVGHIAICPAAVYSYPPKLVELAPNDVPKPTD